MQSKRERKREKQTKLNEEVKEKKEEEKHATVIDVISRNRRHLQP